MSAAIEESQLPGDWGSAEEVGSLALELMKRVERQQRANAEALNTANDQTRALIANYNEFALDYWRWYEAQSIWFTGLFGNDAAELRRYVSQHNEYVARLEAKGISSGLPSLKDDDREPEEEVNWKLWAGVGLGIVALVAVGYVVTSGTGLARVIQSKRAMKAGEPEIRGFAPVARRKAKRSSKRSRARAQLAGLKAPRPIAKNSRAPTRYALEVE